MENIKINRIVELFKEKEAINEKYFMPFLMCGDPSIEQFTSLVKKIDQYIDILELGADGIIIGSAIIDVIKRNLSDFTKLEKELVEFVSSINNAIKRLNQNVK